VHALDECPKKERKAFYEKALKPILSAKINLMITSRKEPDIEHAIMNMTSCEICIQNDDFDTEVQVHVRSVISQEPILQAMKLSLQTEIVNGIVSGASGM
jgi:hypothetical protein